MAVLDREKTPGQVLGLDLGTTNVRLHVARYDAHGKLVGAPGMVHLPGCERDGALPAVLKLDVQGELLAYGRPALQELTRSTGDGFVFEFKPCIGQSPADLQAHGRPDKARFCPNAACHYPGWAWSVAMRFCGFCAAPLQDVPANGTWTPVFRYAQEQALGYAGLLLTHLSGRLQTQFNQVIGSQNGWRITAGVPVHWQEETLRRYRGTIQRAFPEAEIELMSEPAGAVRYYASQGLSLAENGWTLIVDFGAGTTDLVLARALPDESGTAAAELEEAQSYGERYGGGDFDLMLAHHAASELGVQLDGGLLAQWKIQAREWKETFSAHMHQDPTRAGRVDFPFPVPRTGSTFEYVPVVLERATFERVAAELMERFRSVLERGIQRFRLPSVEVDQVVLTGGGAHWYFVQETVRELFPRARIVGGVEPEKSISRGLCLSPLYPARRPERGSDLRLPLALSWQQALEGGIFPVTADGAQLPVAVSGGARTGQEVRIPGGGGPGRFGGLPGDLLVVLEVAPAPVAGENVELDLPLTWVEAQQGCRKVVGEGDRLAVVIPAGAVDGQQICLPGAGAPGRDGGLPGDAVVTLRVSPEPLRGPDLAFSLSLSWDEAQAGCEKTLEHSGSRFKVGVSPASAEGELVRVRGAGAPGKNGGPPGDAVVTLQVAPRPQAGACLRKTIELSWEEAQRGGRFPVELEMGAIDLPLPPGLRDGQTLTYGGFGLPGQHGGAPGDLQVTLRVAPEPVRGPDMPAVLRVTWNEAQRGCKKRPEIAGKPVEVEVPPVSSSGEVLRVRGAGGPGSHGGPAGDLLVTLEVGPRPVRGQNVEMPLSLTLQQAREGGVFRCGADKQGVEVRVPPAVADGQVLTVTGQGGPGEHGGSPGDLVVQVRLEPEECPEESPVPVPPVPEFSTPEDLSPSPAAGDRGVPRAGISLKLAAGAGALLALLAALVLFLGQGRKNAQPGRGAAALSTAAAGVPGPNAAKVPAAAPVLLHLELCADSGKRPGKYCPRTVRRDFNLGAAPTQRCTLHRVRKCPNCGNVIRYDDDVVCSRCLAKLPPVRKVGSL